MSQPSSSAARGSPTSSAATAPSAAATGDFVVNLCASTTPMALAKPTAPELARYTFFVSRRREEGRERFRLHMGYFATREEAEQMLALVRDLYPAAWVGETPGRKLAAPARAPAATPPPAAAPPSTEAARAAPAVAVPPAGGAAPAVTAATPARAATPAPAASTPAKTSDGPPPKMTAAPAPTPAARAPVAAKSAPVPAAVASAAPTGRKPVTARAPMPPASNVREVIAALSPDTDAAASGTVQMPIPPPPVGEATRAAAIAARQAAAKAPPASRGAAPVAPRSAAAPDATPAAAARPRGPAVPVVESGSPAAEMTDSQVLRVLENHGTADRAGSVPGARDIALLSPQDTQTWKDIKAQIRRDAVVHFAVQLNWSVSPIDLARVPSLAIFNAYTLYKIEGNREGRKWYGLRLGFFSDAVSAKQVAHYVRSEFAQVAVVPVSVSERDRATQIGAIALPAAPPAARASASSADEFKLIDDGPPSGTAHSEEIVLSTTATPAAPTAAVRPVAASPAAHAPAATARRPNRPRGAPQSLEETLEILGASQLSIDTGRGERVVIDGRPRAVDPPTSTFSRLLDRLGEKLRR